MRLLPSQVGYCISSEARKSGADVGSGVALLSEMTGVSSGLTLSPAQLAGGIPGSDVSRQQIVIARAKMKMPMVITSARHQKTIWRTENR